MAPHFKTSCLRAFWLIAFVLLSSSAFAQQKLFALKTAKWTQSTISVSWDNPESWNKEYRETVRQAVLESWEKHSGINFTFWGASSDQVGEIRIKIYNGTPKVEALGNQIKNVRGGVKLNFRFDSWSPDCKTDPIRCIKAQAVHEFGHALGIAHEQKRTDCKFEGCKDSPQGEMGSWVLSPCDEKSVMNSCNEEWNNGGNLSEEDIKAIKVLYPKKNFNKFAKAQTALVWNASPLHKRSNLTRVKRYFFRILISDEPIAINSIEKVVYAIDEKDIKVRTITVKNIDDNFAIGFEGVADTQVSANIHYKNGMIVKHSASLRSVNVM